MSEFALIRILSVVHTRKKRIKLITYAKTKIETCLLFVFASVSTILKLAHTTFFFFSKPLAYTTTLRKSAPFLKK